MEELELCDYCLVPVQVHCTNCGHGYCVKCSCQRHQHPARRDHNIVPLLSDSSFEKEEEFLSASQQGETTKKLPLSLDKVL